MAEEEQRPLRLSKLPPTCLAGIFENLDAAQQVALRETSTLMVRAFDKAVENGDSVALAVQLRVNDADDDAHEFCRFCPATEKSLVAPPKTKAADYPPVPVVVVNVEQFAKQASRSGSTSTWLRRGLMQHLILRKMSRGVGNGFAANSPHLETVLVQSSKCHKAERQNLWHLGVASTDEIPAALAWEGSPYLTRENTSDMMGSPTLSSDMYQSRTYSQLLFANMGLMDPFTGAAVSSGNGGAAGDATAIAIGDSFCSGCPNLKSVRFNGGTRITAIQDGFLRDCKSLSQLQLDRLRWVTSIGDFFLAETPALRDIDFQPLHRVETIGANFLRRSGLVTVSFDGLSSLRRVGDDWFAFSGSLESADFQHLVSLEIVGNGWMSMCKKLTTVKLPEGSTCAEHGAGSGHVTRWQPSKMRRVGTSWFDNCTSLTTVDYSACGNLHQVGDRWMLNCSGLTSVNLKGLRRLQSVGPSWLDGCTSLRSITFDELDALREVGHSWMLNCRGLAVVQFNALPRIVRVGPSWLDGCGRLEEADFGGLTYLDQIGQRWLTGCKNLKRIKPPPHPEARALLAEAVKNNLPA